MLNSLKWNQASLSYSYKFGIKLEKVFLFHFENWQTGCFVKYDFLCKTKSQLQQKILALSMYQKNVIKSFLGNNDSISNALKAKVDKALL